MELQYFKTDRNGTKYYYDYTCPRCGGAGFSDNWWATGRTCYECGGTGKRSSPKIVKVYTDEYQARLDARRCAKAKASAELDMDDVKRRVAESEARARENFFATYGFDANGHGWAYVGKTYTIKQELREAGGKWLQTFQIWVCPQRIEVGKGVEIIEVDISDKADVINQCLGDAYRYLDNIK